MTNTKLKNETIAVCSKYGHSMKDVGGQPSQPFASTPALLWPGLGGPWSLFSCPAWRQGCSWCLAVPQLQGFYPDLPGGSCGWAAGREAVSWGWPSHLGVAQPAQLRCCSRVQAWTGVSLKLLKSQSCFHWSCWILSSLHLYQP